MENLLLDPRFLLPLFLAIVAVISYSVRVEMKVFFLGKKTDELKSENAELWSIVEQHKENSNIHFNRDVTRQVDEKNELRFKKIDAELSEIKADVKELLRKK